ncbi:efflux RND transporter periplasmic adaptor subunit [Methylophaga lonarensis]|nr:efflux RND transporter periplasmic adaptor subunit [Methylophaga lonarensis]
MLAVLLTCLMMCLPTAASADPAIVMTTTPKSALSGQAFRLSGSLTAERESRLSPQVEGLVSRVFVDAGDRVKQGDVLLQLDTAVARDQLAQAEARLLEAQTLLTERERLVNEAQRLRQQNHISETESARRLSEQQMARAALDAAEAAKRLAQTFLQQHSLRAPFDGVIKNKWTEAGEWIQRGTAVLELVATQPIRLDVQVPQERFSALNTNTPVSIFPDALPGVEIPAQITAIVPVGDQNARAFLVRIVVEPDQHLLLPGTSAVAEFRLQYENDPLIVPRDALLRHPDGNQSVFVIKDGIAYRQPVKTGARLSEGVVITDGLTADAEVVIRGNEGLRDGQSVHVEEF